MLLSTSYYIEFRTFKYGKSLIWIEEEILLLGHCESLCHLCPSKLRLGCWLLFRCCCCCFCVSQTTLCLLTLLSIFICCYVLDRGSRKLTMCTSQGLSIEFPLIFVSEHSPYCPGSTVMNKMFLFSRLSTFNVQELSLPPYNNFLLSKSEL